MKNVSMREKKRMQHQAVLSVYKGPRIFTSLFKAGTTTLGKNGYLRVLPTFRVQLFTYLPVTPQS